MSLSVHPLANVATLTRGDLQPLERLPGFARQAKLDVGLDPGLPEPVTEMEARFIESHRSRPDESDHYKHEEIRQYETTLICLARRDGMGHWWLL